MSPDFSCEDPGLLPDLFHALNQPLTTLRCCLELCLQPASRLDNHIRRNLRLALRQAESVVFLARGIRELVNPRAAEVIPEEINLADSLCEMAGELSPLAEMEKKRLLLNVHVSCPVNLGSTGLREALFRLIEFAIRYARAGTSIKLAVEQKGGTARLTIRFAAGRSRKTSALKPQSLAPQELKDRLDLAIIRRILTDAGCVFEVANRSNRYSLQLRMPLALREPAVPLTRNFRRRA